MINIAIDGPGGAGKSTISRLPAKEMGFVYVDTGALYRCIGLFALRSDADTKDSPAVTQLLDRIKVSLTFVDGEQHVILNGEDVSAEIRMPEVSLAASDVSAIPQVRSFLLSLQKDIAAQSNCIMDGRDIGTVVLPNADVKIFLTAAPEDRARRRYDELVEKGVSADYETVLKELILRDEQDTKRAAAPLKAAEDAVTVDTTGNDLETSVAVLKKLISDKTDSLNTGDKNGK